MLKNVNDYLSLFSLSIMSLIAFVSFLRSFVSHKNDLVNVTRLELLRNYLDNEDE